MIEALKPTEDELTFINSNPDFQVCIERWGKDDGVLKFAIVPIDCSVWKVFLEGSEDKWTEVAQLNAGDDGDGFNACLNFINEVETKFDSLRRLEQSVVMEKKEEPDPPMIRISQETTDEFVSILNNTINLVMGLGYLYIFYLILSAFFNFLHR
jgi:hypothetical protein